MFIGGEWVDASDGKTREIISPATGEVDRRGPRGTAEDVDRAVAAAKKAFDETWSDARPASAAALLKMADIVEQHADELGRIESENVGKVLALTMSEEVPVIADQFRFFAGGRPVPGGPGGRRVHEGLHEHAPARADRRGRTDRAVELPAVHGGVEARPGARGRQLRGDQAVRDGPRSRCCASPSWSPRPRCSRRACSTSSPATASRSGDAHRHAPGRRHRVADRRDVDRQADLQERGRHAEARAPGARRQGAR